MKPIYALFPDAEAAGRAIQSLLREAGVDARDIVVVSSEPLEHSERGWPRQSTRMGWLAALGGLFGGVSGHLLTAFTQREYPIVTGAMPVVTWWTNGIIIYEMTMLGAILAILLTLLVSTPLPNWKPQLYDPEISEGKVLVGLVSFAEKSRGELERRLGQAGEAKLGRHQA